MPRVNVVEKSNKDQGACGKCGVALPKRSAYKWWKFRWGGRHVRCTKPECAPTANDLTQSEYTQGTNDFDKTLEGISLSERTIDAAESVKSDLESLADEIESFGQEQSDKRDNMPYQLQDSDTGTLLQERAEACNNTAETIRSAAGEIETKIGELLDPDDSAAKDEFIADLDDPREEGEEDEDFDARVREAIEETNSSTYDEIESILEGVETDWGS